MTTPQSPLLSTLGRRTAVALSLVLVLFFALNLLATSVSTSWRLDLTAQRLYTLSPASQNVIDKIDEPITLRLFYSSSIAAAAPAIGSYAQRVKDLLQEYASLSNGRIRLEIIDPAPFSEAEDRAVSYGLQKVPLGGDEDGVFLGLVGTNTTDDVEAIAFLQPNREPFLEYDISKIVYGLSHVERTVVGIISTLPINGRASYNQQTGQQETVKPFAIMAQIEDFFDTKMLELDLTRIPEDVTVLMVVHPKNLPPQTLYAIDQFALGGGKVFAFVDSYAEIEVQNSRNPTMAGVEANSIPADLLAAWGIKINELEVAADRLTARRVSMSQGAPPVPYLPWLILRETNFNAGSPITSGVSTLALGSAAVIESLPAATTVFEPLVRTSPGSTTLSTGQIMGRVDPRRLLRDFKPGVGNLTLAARLTGPASSAYPDGRPDGLPAIMNDAGQAVDVGHRANGEIDLIVFADVDLLVDRFWVNTRSFFGREVVTPVAGNGIFIVNALDALAGDSALLDLRGQGFSQRPFTVVENLKRAAEGKYRAKEQELRDKLSETEKKLAELTAKGASTANALISDQDRQQIDRYQRDLLSLRADLRAVQRSLREDLDDLREKLLFVNIAAVPLLLAALAVLLSVWRRRNRARHAVHQ